MLTLCEPSSALQREPLQTVEELIRGQCGLRARWKSIQQSSDSAALKNTKPQEEHLPPQSEDAAQRHTPKATSLPPQVIGHAYIFFTHYVSFKCPSWDKFSDLYSLIPMLANTVGASKAAKPRPKLVKQMYDKRPFLLLFKTHPQCNLNWIEWKQWCYFSFKYTTKNKIVCSISYTKDEKAL